MRKRRLHLGRQKVTDNTKPFLPRGISGLFWVSFPEKDKNRFIPFLRLLFGYRCNTLWSCTAIPLLYIPNRFYARDSGLLKFKIQAGLLGRPVNHAVRRLVAFTFHPFEPFAISVQRTNAEYVVNFHMRHVCAWGESAKVTLIRYQWASVSSIWRQCKHPQAKRQLVVSKRGRKSALGPCLLFLMRAACSPTFTQGSHC